MAEYLIQGETLTGIANAIREKADISSPLYPDSMPSYIRSIQTSSSDTSEIPDYVVAEGKRVASGMVSKRGANSLTAVIMSDMHEFGDNDHTDATIIERYRRANRNAGQGAKVVSDNIDLDFFANLGDLTWGAKTSTVTDFVQGIVNARNYMYDVTKDHESFITPGNHDTATYGFAQNNEYLSQTVVDGLIGTYRYVDFAAKKIRVICLNTAEVEGLAVSGQSGTERITGTQLQWFADALDLSAKSDAANWGIIILSHHPLDWGTILPAANCL
jgi:3',5'-cyclic AMP phosphodiesterase CpdA